MLFTLMLGFAAAGRLTGKKRKIAQIALYISAAAEGTIIVLSCTGVSAIYDMYLPWAVLQEVISRVSGAFWAAAQDSGTDSYHYSLYAYRSCGGCICCPLFESIVYMGVWSYDFFCSRIHHIGHC